MLVSCVLSLLAWLQWIYGEVVIWLLDWGGGGHSLVPSRPSFVSRGTYGPRWLLTIILLAMSKW